MATNRIGKQTLIFPSKPCVISQASIVGDKEGAGPLAGRFDMVLEDDTWGEKSWEKAECKMFEQAVMLAASKGGTELSSIHCMLGGDLLNQLVTANYAARGLVIPFLGLYGACSTMTESLLIGSMMIDGQFAQQAVCTASSHFSTAERQFRYPLEMGSTTAPTAQRTVTGAGSIILGSASSSAEKIYISAGTIGTVIDLGVTDLNNMGAAMAPAAAYTICTHLQDMQRSIKDYDLIVTGDLGRFGSEMLFELCSEKHVDITGKHADCGCLIFSADQKVDCGGSGCGCSAVTLCAYILPRLQQNIYKRVLFLSTGALMSPATSMQGESIPGIAHAIVLEREEEA